MGRKKRIAGLTILLMALIFGALARHAASFLVVNNAEKSDVIVVLAGETQVRPKLAAELLRQGMAEHELLNVQTRDQVYDEHLTDVALRYVNGLREANRISICPLVGLSTDTEAVDVSRCLQPFNAHRLLLVTSDYHTRRTLMIFRHRFPQYQISVAAAHDPVNFGETWWSERQWAKTTLDEWEKLLWWEMVDRWR
jgi:uncharacterized SAM-binding protein YcdF (DUF218 family)